MSNEHNILQKITEKLGLRDDLINKKTKELLRILRGKGSVKALSDSAKIILCLDLAATYLGVNFDRESAIRLSGLKKSIYQNSLHTVEKVLELDRPLTISELCVQFSCASVKDLAENIFEKYRCSNKVDNVAHPQYAAASVYTACRLKNVKVQKSQFLSTSHLKAPQWKELTDDFDKFVTSSGIVSPKKKTKEGNIKEPVATDIIDILEKNNFKGNPEEEECEPYEVWRERILSEAYEALKNGEKMYK